MKYNCGEHIQFLNYQQELKKQNKSLRTQDPIKYSKLRKYSARISEYLHWSQKNEYLQLIKDFLNYKIDGKEFDQKFSKMVTVIEKKSNLLFKNYEELKGIEPSPISLGFGTWISEIYLCCNEFYEDYDLNEGEDPALKTEEQLRDAVKSLFPEIQKYLPILQKSCDLNDSFFRPQMDLDQLIRRSYLIFILSSLGLVLSLSIPV